MCPPRSRGPPLRVRLSAYTLRARAKARSLATRSGGRSGDGPAPIVVNCNGTRTPQTVRDPKAGGALRSGDTPGA